MIQSVEDKWLNAQKHLLSAIEGKDQVSFLIPGWDPVDLSMALRWLQSSTYEGFQVTFDVQPAFTGFNVRFSIQEPDCD